MALTAVGIAIPLSASTAPAIGASAATSISAHAIHPLAWGGDDQQ
jgi:hypothetical protein